MASNDGFVNRRMILESRRRRHAASKKPTAAEVAAQQRMALSAGGGDFTQRFNQDDDSEEQSKSSSGDKIGSSTEDSDDDNNTTYFQNVLQTALGKETSKKFEYLFQSPKRGQQLHHEGVEEGEEINLLDGIISATSSSTELVDEESHSTASTSQRSSTHQSISAASLLRRTLLDDVPSSNSSSTASRRKFPQDASNSIVSPSANDDDDLKRRLQQVADEREQINALHELRRKRKLDMIPSRQKERERNQQSQSQGQGKRKPQLASPTSTVTTSSTSTSTGFAEQRRNTATSMDEGTFLSPIDSRSQKVSKTSATPLWASLVSKTTEASEADLRLQNEKPASTFQDELDDRKQRRTKNKEPWKSPLPNLSANQDNAESKTVLASEEPPYHSNRQQRQYQGGFSRATPSSSGNAVPNVATYTEQQQLNEHERLKVLLDYETDRRKDTEARLLALEMELKELKGRNEPILTDRSSASRTSAVSKSTTKISQQTKTANDSSQTPRRLLIQTASEAFGSLPETGDRITQEEEYVSEMDPLYLNRGKRVSPRRAMLQQAAQAFDQTEEDLQTSKAAESRRFTSSGAKDDQTEGVNSTSAATTKWWRESPDAEERYLEERQKCEDLARELEALEMKYATEKQDWQAQLKKYHSEAKNAAKTDDTTQQGDAVTMRSLQQRLDEATRKITDVESQLERSESMYSQEKIKWQEQLETAKLEREDLQLEKAEAQFAQDKAEWRAQLEAYFQIESERDELRIQVEATQAKLEQEKSDWKERLQHIESDHKLQLQALETQHSHNLGHYREQLEQVESERDILRARLEKALELAAYDHSKKQVETVARVVDNEDDEWHDAADQYPLEVTDTQVTTQIAQFGTYSEDGSGKIDALVKEKQQAEENCSKLTAELVALKESHSRERDGWQTQLNAVTEKLHKAQWEDKQNLIAREETQAKLDSMTAQFQRAEESCTRLSGELRDLETSHAKENEEWQSLLDTSLGENPPLNRSNYEADSISSNVFVLQGRIEWLERELNEVTAKHAKEQRIWHEQLQDLMESPLKDKIDKNGADDIHEDGEAVPTTEWKLQVERKRSDLLERHCRSIEAKYAKEEEEWKEQLEMQVQRYQNEVTKCQYLSEQVNILQDELKGIKLQPDPSGKTTRIDSDGQEQNFRDDEIGASPANLTAVTGTSPEDAGFLRSAPGFDETLDCSAIRAALGSFDADADCNSERSGFGDLNISLDAVITEMKEDCKDFNVLMKQVGCDDKPILSRNSSKMSDEQEMDSGHPSNYLRDRENAEMKDAKSQQEQVSVECCCTGGFIDSTISLVHNLTDMVHHKNVEDDIGHEKQLSVTLSEEEVAKHIPTGKDAPHSTNKSMALGKNETIHSIHDGTNPWISLVQELQQKCEFLQADRLELARTVNDMLDMERETHRLAVDAAVATAERKASEKLVAYQTEAELHVHNIYRLLCEHCRNQIFRGYST